LLEDTDRIKITLPSGFSFRNQASLTYGHSHKQTIGYLRGSFLSVRLLNFLHGIIEYREIVAL